MENTVNDQDAGVISVSDAAVIAMINEVPAGGTVSIPDLAETGLSASVVQAIMARNGEPINFTYYI